MDGWGSLTMLIKRQNAEKWRKSDLKYKLQKKKESYLKGKQHTDEFDFPVVSDIEMRKIKDEIRKEIRRQKIKSYLFTALLFVIVVALIILYIKNLP